MLSAAENRHDTSGHHELLSKDIVVHVPGGDELRGIKGYCAMMEAFFVGLPDYRAELIHAANSGDSMLVHWAIAGTHGGELFGHPPTGRSVHYTGCSVWRAERGRITEGWLYPDRAAMLAQLE